MISILEVLVLKGFKVRVLGRQFQEDVFLTFLNDIVLKKENDHVDLNQRVK